MPNKNPRECSQSAVALSPEGNRTGSGTMALVVTLRATCQQSSILTVCVCVCVCVCARARVRVCVCV
jgi:hypothetical protein